MLLALVLLPFFAAALMPLLYAWLGRRVGYAALAFAAVVLGLLLRTWPDVAAGAGPVFRAAWVPQLGIYLSLGLDGFSFLFALLIAGIGVLVLAYSVPYLGAREDLGKFYLYMMMFMGAMLGVALSRNLIALYVFWELTSFSSFLLIGFWYTRETGAYGALKSMLITVSGGFAMLAGFVLIYAVTGTFELGELVAARDQLLAHPLALPALVLVLLGAFTKSAQVPFHIWLPDAMAAPTPVSAYLHSATMVKAGLFLVGRFWPLYAGTAEWAAMVTTVGLFTMLLGAFLALRKTDLKAILAMSTVSQLGLIMTLLGLGTPAAATAAVAHILSHATFKGSLFLVAGIIDHETGTRDIRMLGGLRHKMPVSFALAALAAAAMAGIPPLNGFVTKEMFFDATLDAGGWVPLVSVLGAALTTTYSLILGYRIWFMPAPGQTPKAPHEAPPSMWWPPAVLVALVVAIGVAPGLMEPLVTAAVSSVVGVPQHPHLVLWHGLNVPLGMSALAIGGGLLLYRWLAAGEPLLERLAPRHLHANALYDWLWWDGKAVEKLAGRLTRAHMTGLLRDYLVFLLGAASIAVLAAVWSTGVLRQVRLDLSPVDSWEPVLMVLIAVGAVAAVMARSRLFAIVALGLVGVPMAALFAVLRAPDLALTQLVVEVVTAVLYLLLFAHLPQLRVYPRTASYQDLNLVVALLVGGMTFLLTLIAVAVRPFAPISDYFVQNSYTAAGGKNIVNVILVDFRGLDTMGEITVVAIAALAIYMLIHLQLKDTGSKGEAGR